MKLTETDFKLLSYLYHHNREPITKIAKATKLSREQVDYKIKKYINEELIRRFFTLFDWTKFDYNCYGGLFLKFEKPSSTKEFIQNLKQDKNTMSYGKVFSRFDIYLNVIFKDEKEMSEYITNLISDSENPISNYSIIKPYFSELYPLKFFNQKNKETYTFTFEPSQKRKFDQKEITILKTLAKNARAKLIDISKKANISIELAHHKIKKLQEDKVILGSRIQFNMEKLGYYFSVIFLNMRNFSKTNQEKIKNFSRNSPHITAVNLLLSKPNCVINLFHKNESELRNTIEEIRKLFKDESIEMNILPISDDTEEINTLPFL